MTALFYQGGTLPPPPSFINLASGETKFHKYKGTDNAYIHDVKLLGNDTGTDILQSVCITYAIQVHN